MIAVERLLLEPRTAQGIAIAIGWAFGCSGQTFVQFFDDKRWQVYDLTISEDPFPRAEYHRAVHIVAGTVWPIPNRAALRAFAQVRATYAAAYEERRASQALACQRKEGN